MSTRKDMKKGHHAPPPSPIPFPHLKRKSALCRPSLGLQLHRGEHQVEISLGVGHGRGVGVAPVAQPAVLHHEPFALPPLQARPGDPVRVAQLGEPPFFLEPRALQSRNGVQGLVRHGSVGFVAQVQVHRANVGLPPARGYALPLHFLLSNNFKREMKKKTARIGQPGHVSRMKRRMQKLATVCLQNIHGKMNEPLGADSRLLRWLSASGSRGGSTRCAAP